MLFNAQRNPEDPILEYLAQAYRCYNQAEWHYDRSDAGIGGFLVDGCIEDAHKLSLIVTTIGKGLLDGKKMQ